MKIDARKPLYIVTDGGILRRQGRLIDSITEALEGARGKVAFVQLREQVVGPQASAFAAASDSELLNLIAELRPTCTKFGAKLLVNGRPELARQGGADGVHLNVYSASVANTRGLFGDEFVIGFSAHDLVEARKATEEGADYLLCSPVFTPSSKKSPRPMIGLEGLKSMVQSVNVPVFALGGITKENAAACRDVGAAGIAAITAVLGVAGPRRGTAELVQAWEKGSL